MRDFETTRRGALAAVAGLLATPALAQAWPDRPIRLVIPFPAGGPTDVYARFYAERMTAELGQSVVTENRGGAGGAIGAMEVARARPDGNTLLFGTASTHALYNLVTRQPQYDAAKDFQAVATLGGGPLCWLAHPGQPGTLADFLAKARTARPPLAYGSPGTGTLMHLATEILKREAGGVEINHIPYRGAAPAMNDLVAGTLALAVNTLGAGLALHQSGRARMLAVASAARAPQAPEVPTAAEALGRPGFTAVLWHAVFAPPGLPPAVLARLSAATNAALSDAAFRTRLNAAGIEPAAPGTPGSAAAYIAAEQARYRPIVEAIRPELDA
ncbi:Bug family tripartite tricarboxylate transporter substrate binding protein [Falsiroseomonas selenitidurans]|uniref:Tripartite tricarboxylate transporter substrate binding protein n=1 Tax=Falsiroseomonas selenitidurans TaxID=2716335 RepID=A0ABX1E8V3_9PROT|nr:tripartite tricarboxylate transporter substrate binding protein [Falsiroseomonas selenitidurans]NKC33649.1 tripartite tricarboxylate transporter substrate binding protein [Falsiroseomonas selenitidurans]